MRRLHPTRVNAFVAVLLLPPVLSLGGCRDQAGAADGEAALLAERTDLEDSVGTVTRMMERRTRTYERVSEEKDSLIQGLATAMLLFNELTAVEREIVGEEAELDREGTALAPWDQRVRGQLQRLRTRYAQLADNVSRAESRIVQLEARDKSMRASLDEALRTAAALRDDNEKKQALIDQLTQRVATLTGERDAAVALSVARADTIVSLAEENNTVYWIAGTEPELRSQGLIQTVGGRRLLVTRVGESLAPSRTIDTSRFTKIDRRRIQMIDLPGNVEYEVLTTQNMNYVDRATVRLSGQRWFVRNQLRITDPRFWDTNAMLIMVRR